MLARTLAPQALMTLASTDCRLIIVLETDAHGAGLERLEAMLAAGGTAIACVLLTPLPGVTLGTGELGSAIRRIQARDVAVLLQADVELARALGADGVHLTAGSDEDEARSRYAIARAALGSERTVGASAGLSKHMAMVYGEIGADYVAFEGRPVRGKMKVLARWRNGGPSCSRSPVSPWASTVRPKRIVWPPPASSSLPWSSRARRRKQTPRMSP
ncbi:MAG: thiamine phosphate synthase [Hyphomicrobiaceae bacterium]